MHRPARPFSDSLSASATGAAKTRIEHALDHLRRLQEDPLREQRLIQQFCRSCFYREHIGSAAVTHQPCGACGVDCQYGSTNTDVLCQPCAVSRAVCKHCGANMAEVDAFAQSGLVR